MHVPRQLVSAVVLLAVSLAGLAPARTLASAPGPLAGFQSQLSAFSGRAPGHVAIAVEDVATGLTTGVNAGAEMPAASTIKIPVMVEVFRQLVGGRFDLNTRVALRRSDKDWGSGDLADARVGSRYPVSQLLARMIDVSDNTATNMLIRLVGRPHINATMAEYGLTHTRLTDFIRSSGPIRWALRSSPGDMARLLTRMAKEQLIDEWSSRAMIAILRGQRHNGLLPEPLPKGTAIAHKTGTLHDTLNDVGIVYGANDEPYVIAVMTTDLPTLDAGRRFIRGVSRMAFAALGHFAAWRADNTLDAPFDADRVAPQATDDAAGAPTPDKAMWAPRNAPAFPLAPNAIPNPAPQAAPSALPTDAPRAESGSRANG